MSEIELSRAEPRIVMHGNKVFFPSGQVEVVDDNRALIEQGRLPQNATISALVADIPTLLTLAKAHQRLSRSFLYINYSTDYTDPFPAVVAVPNPYLAQYKYDPDRDSESEVVELKGPSVSHSYKWLCNFAVRCRIIGNLLQRVCCTDDAEDFVEFAIANMATPSDDYINDLHGLLAAIRNHTFKKESREHEERSETTSQVTVERYFKQQTLDYFDRWFDLRVYVYDHCLPDSFSSMRWLFIQTSFRFRMINRRNVQGFQIELKHDPFVTLCDRVFDEVKSDIVKVIDQVPGLELLHAHPQGIHS